MKWVISMNYGSSTSSWKLWRWMRLDQIFSTRGIYFQPEPTHKITSSSRSRVERYPPMENLSNDHKDRPNQHKMKLCYKAMRWSRTSRCKFDRKSMETETTTWSEFPNGEKPIAEQTLASEERNKSKRAGLWELQSLTWVGKLTIWV